MEPGEYRFNNVEYVEINKPLMGKLYASALYWTKNKYILEILAPKDLISTHHEWEDSNKTIGEMWAQNLKEDIKLPLENANYYIEINGIKIGENAGTATRYRYEPNPNQEKEIEEIISEENLNPTSNTSEILKDIEENIAKYISSTVDDISSIFQDEEFQETIISSIASLPVINLENDEDSYLKYYEERERKERDFFEKFRSNINIPHYLKNESIVIADLIFKIDDTFAINTTISDLKFIVKNYRRNYLTRINFQLPFGEYEEPVESFSKTQKKFVDKILIEGLIEYKKDDEPISKYISNNMPKGKKAMYVIYEIIDNISILPIFHTTELLNDYSLSNYIFCEPVLLKEKGLKHFDKYIAFVGYIDEGVTIGDFELFQLIVTFECNKQFYL